MLFFVICLLRVFQSTLPREERLKSSGYFVGICHFNPRSHERSDQGKESITQDIKISIHAPTRGATVIMVLLLLLKIFQSTLPREERPRRRALGCQLFVFQSTLPREERRFNYHDIQPIYYFNPRSHERSDIKWNHLRLQNQQHFNPRSHERSDVYPSFSC